MTSREFRALGKECEALLRSLAPYDTGNLHDHGVQFEMPDKDTIHLYIDESEAPYMKYTNEKWERGKNPNEGWFDRAVEQIAALIAERTQGELKK